MAYPILLILFLTSGVAGLGYQMVWTRQFATGLGHEMPAVLAVVGSIFGGMAVGAWASDMVLNRSGRPGRCYGLLELIIGAWGVLSAALVPFLNAAALRLIGLETSPFRHWLVAFGLPLVALLPATASMGATFPAMIQFANRTRGRPVGVGAFYAANTAGALLGIVLSIYVLVPVLGFRRTLLACSFLSLAGGIVALLMDRRQIGFCRPAAPPIELRTVPKVGSSRGRTLRSGNPDPGRVRLGVTLWLTGLLGIGYEVLGVRLLAGVLENTVYSYAAVLGVFLLGTAGGAWLFHRRAARSSLAADDWLGLLAAMVMAGSFLLSRTPEVFHLLRTRLGDGLTALRLAEWLTAALVFLLPTFGMGALFSLLVQRAADRAWGVGRAVALNTLGSALAPLVFGVLLLPGVGGKWSLVLLALGYVALIASRPGIWCGLGLAAAVGFAAALPSQLRFVDTPEHGSVLFYRDGVMDSVAVVEEAGGNRSLLVDNRFMMGGTGAAPAERRHADIPLLLHPSPKNALFLGLGTGISFASAAAEPDLVADGVELVPEVVQALPWFAPENALPRATGRFRIWTADARRFVRVCPKRYDVVVADLFHPARDGAGALYSFEHFRAIRSRLNPNGLFCQWLPLFQLSEPMLRVIVRTFQEAFPDARAFLLRPNVDTPVLGLVGSVSPDRLTPEYFEARTQSPSLREHLRSDQLHDAWQFYGCFLAGPRALQDYSQGAALNTDDHPVVVFGAPDLDPTDPSYGRLLRFIAACPHDPADWFQPGTRPEFLQALESYLDARDVYLRGLVAETEGNLSQAIDLYVESARRSSQFSTGYAQCLTLAVQEAGSDPAAARRLLERLVQAQPNRPVAAELLRKLVP